MTKHELIQDILRITDMQKVMQLNIETQISQMPEEHRESVMESCKRFYSDEFVGKIVAIWERIFDEDEVRFMHCFYTSETGLSIFKKMASTSKEMMYLVFSGIADILVKENIITIGEREGYMHACGFPQGDGAQPLIQ